MKMNKILSALFIPLFLSAVFSCHKKAATNNSESTKTEFVSNDTLIKISSKDPIEGTYTANSEDCLISLVISKDKIDYQYILKTKLRTLKGKAVFSPSNSGEKYISLKGIQWDEYEGDISNEEENDSVSSKDLEIPVGIDALYIKDTLTIQNYGNAMNSYTKISECEQKYIQLIKKKKSN